MEEEITRNYCIFDATDKRVVKLKNPNNLLLILEILRDHQLSIYTAKDENLSGVDLHADIIAREMAFTETTEDEIIVEIDGESFLKRFPVKVKQELTRITDAIVEQYSNMTYDVFSNMDRCSKLQYCMGSLNCNGYGDTYRVTFVHLCDNEWYDHNMIVMKIDNICALASTLLNYLSEWENLEDINEIKELLKLVAKYKSLKGNSKLSVPSKDKKDKIMKMNAF